MGKIIINKEAMEKKAVEGLELITSIVRRTLGPGGQPILIERTAQALDGSKLGPAITKDGVTVAEECESDDPELDVIIQAAKVISAKTNKVAGDGTTTALVLGQAIHTAALEEIKKTKANPQAVRRSIEAAMDLVLDKMKSYITKVDNDLDIVKQVATISANGDEEIGEIIAKAFDKVGCDGSIVVDEGHGRKTTLEIIDGYQINRGAEANELFYNKSNRFEVEDCYVSIFDGPLNSSADVILVLKSLEQHLSKEKGETVEAMPPVVFIANEFSKEAIDVLAYNNKIGVCKVCAVRSPHMSTVRTSMLEDLAVALGGAKMGKGNPPVSSTTYLELGYAKKLVVTKYTTTFYDGAGSEKEILARVDKLTEQKKDAESPYDAEIIAGRMSSLTSGVAKIGVGGVTEMAQKELYYRIEDALSASRAAVEEGVIPGGGIVLAKIGDSLKGETSGERILKKALKAPFNQIYENLESLDQVDLNAELKKGKNWTVDANTLKSVDAFAGGILDPAKVTITAFNNACSIANLLLTQGGAIVYKRDNSKSEEEKAAALLNA